MSELTSEEARQGLKDRKQSLARIELKLSHIGNDVVSVDRSGRATVDHLTSIRATLLDIAGMMRKLLERGEDGAQPERTEG